MLKKVALLLVATASAGQCQSATWNAFYAAATDTTMTFFDLDTVVKQGDAITMSTKLIRDGQLESKSRTHSLTAQSTYRCSDHTFEQNAATSFDREGQLIGTDPNPPHPFRVEPGSSGDLILRIVCAADFPKNPNDLYGPVRDNDPESASSRWFEHTRAKSTTLAPITSTTGAQDNTAVDRVLVGSWASADHQIVEFQADKTFRMYPKCGREADEWKKRGLAFLPASWEIVEGNHLKLTMTFQGKSQTVESTITHSNGELRMTDGRGHTSVSRRYAGTLPPACPADSSR
jgi:hypothetical protein